MMYGSRRDADYFYLEMKLKGQNDFHKYCGMHRYVQPQILTFKMATATIRTTAKYVTFHVSIRVWCVITVKVLYLLTTVKRNKQTNANLSTPSTFCKRRNCWARFFNNDFRGCGCIYRNEKTQFSTNRQCIEKMM